MPVALAHFFKARKQLAIFDDHIPSRNVRTFVVRVVNRQCVDLPGMQAYIQAVYAATDYYLSSLTPEDLDQTVDLSSIGIGQVTRAWVLSRLVIGHADNICGEISCLKGLQGMQGYPI